ncbi:MAG TPA: iron ABC transporter permease [Pseudonocardiaceae bacterium]|nr:iron ABC transporter permease [Pseudonocardiaceae bacterium]
MTTRTPRTRPLAGPEPRIPAPSPVSRWHLRRPGAGFPMLLGVLCLALGTSVLLAVGVGPVAIPPGTSARIVAHHLLPGLIDPDWQIVQDRIVWTFRLPRTLLAVVVGAGLAVVGTVLQAVVRNPLADPYLLGVSSGASLGAVLVLVLGPAVAGGLSLSGAAFLGGLLATGLVYLLAQRGGRISPSRLILAGVALAYLFQACYSFLLLKTQPEATQGVLFWLLGSLGGANWADLTLPTLVLLLGSAVLVLQARPLNSLLAGDETAVSLGLNVNRFRVQLLVVTSLLVGVMVAISGAIAFVGLIVPHMVRLVVGADHRRVLPVAVLTGAVFLVLVDLAARTVNQPAELPLSIVTALVGVPFFLWLLRRRERGREVYG